MRATILINNFNYAAYLGEAIDSALAQDWDDVEVVVVDDGSTDGSAEVLDAYADRVVVVRKPNGGQASAFNTGFEKATNAELKPVKLENTMAFMFETHFPQQVTRYAAEIETRQDDYLECWDGLERKFDGTPGIK